MIARTLDSLARMSLRSSICTLSWSYSSLMEFSSRPVSLWSLMSRIAFACSSSIPSRSLSPSFASSPVLDARMRAMVSSSMLMAFIRPSRMWNLFSAWARSYLVLRTTTSFLCTM